MLCNVFEKLKIINMEIIDSLKRDKFDIELFNKRENIIKEIFSGNFKRDEIRENYKKSNLTDMDGEISNLLEAKAKEIKEEIRKSHNTTRAIQGYSNANNMNRSFYSARI